ncbi:WAP four-disulfide core domain protein 2-like [Ceratina calcarata]|uniref:WAP four-disulfide core domain protein 2-like n=1 Tax=Ceratina calcarata TaxID=156304 RepID=A0AAJ7N6M4_9HYME|nr:WAP four-disulfide core domain protein 2-like [Ceratina calcarata]
MKLLVSMFVLASASIAAGQHRYEPFAEKPGSCPPPMPVQICTQSCFSDSQCLGIGKCCPTNCGGSVCAKPVTTRQTTAPEKPGNCPAVPKGRWVCSPTCTVDADCRGKLKCCINRCGAMACQPPELESEENAPDDSNSVARKPDRPRNPNDPLLYF